MIGQQHRAGTVATSTLVSTIMWKLLLFSPAVFYIIPYSYIMADSPDVDQKDTAPKNWKRLRKIITTMIAAVGVISFGYLCFTGYLIYNGSEYSLNNTIICLIVLFSYLLIYLFSKTKEGKFLTKHRGFTHTLIIPILLGLLYYNIANISKDYVLDQKGQLLLFLINVWIGILVFKDVFNERRAIGKTLNLIANITLGICILVAFINEMKIHDLVAVGVNLSMYIVLGMLVGVSSHIFEDMLCKAGCPILYPFSKKPIHIGTAITSDMSAWVWTIGLIAFCAVFIVFIVLL